MNKYQISYKKNPYTEKEKTVTLTRFGDSAVDVIDKLCDQYHWGFRLNMVDADTRGNDFASASVDTNGGINYNIRVLSCIVEDVEY